MMVSKARRPPRGMRAAAQEAPGLCYGQGGVAVRCSGPPQLSSRHIHAQTFAAAVWPSQPCLPTPPSGAFAPVTHNIICCILFLLRSQKTEKQDLHHLFLVVYQTVSVLVSPGFWSLCKRDQGPSTWQSPLYIAIHGPRQYDPVSKA